MRTQKVIKEVVINENEEFDVLAIDQSTTEEHTVMELCIAMGAVDQLTENPAQYFEEDETDPVTMTQLESACPIPAIDKK